MSEWTESPAVFHDPVLAREVVEFMAPSGDGIYLDGTVGGGGHSAILLEECLSCRIIAVDRDLDALKAAKATLRGNLWVAAARRRGRTRRVSADGRAAGSGVVLEELSV